MRSTMVHLVKFSRLDKKSYGRKCENVEGDILHKVQYFMGSLKMLEYYN